MMIEATNGIPFPIENGTKVVPYNTVSVENGQASLGHNSHPVNLKYHLKSLYILCILGEITAIQ